MRGIPVCLLLLLASACLPKANTAAVKRPAAGPPPAPEPPTIGTWRFSDPHPVTSVAVSKGSVWAGTPWGMVRFDEKDATPTEYASAQGLHDSRVVAVDADGKGRIWVGTQGGLLFRGDGGFEPVTEGLPADAKIQAVTAVGDAAWIGTDRGIWKAKAPDDVVEVVLGPSVVGFAEGGKGVLWAGTRKHGVLRIFDGEAERLGEGHGLAGPGVAGISADAKGGLIAWAGDTLSVYDGTHWFPYRLEQEGVRWDIRGVVADADGWLVLTPFGFRRLRRAKVPSDPEQARPVLALLERTWPRVSPQDIAPQAGKPAAEDKGPVVEMGLPPLPKLQRPEETADADKFDRLKIKAERARGAYQRGLADAAVLTDELAGLEKRKTEAEAEVDALKIKAQDSDLGANGGDDEGDAEDDEDSDDEDSDDEDSDDEDSDDEDSDDGGEGEGEGEEEADPPARNGSALEDAQERARTLGVSFELMRDRAAKAEQEAGKLRDAALVAQAAWTVFEADGKTSKAAIKDAVAQLRKGIELDARGSAAVAEIPTASFPDRTAVETPRHVLVAADWLRDLPPVLVTSMSADQGVVWLGTRHTGVLKVEAKGKRTRYESGTLVPKRASGGPVADRDGQVWVVSRFGDAAYVFDGRDWQREDPSPGARYLAIASDETGRVTLLSADGGTYKLQRRTGDEVPWETVFERTFDENPDSLSISAVSVTGTGTTWLAVELPGSRSRLRPEGVLVLEPGGDAQNHRFDPQLAIGGASPGAELPSDRVTGIALSGDTVRLATYGGLCELRFGGAEAGGSSAPEVRVIGENEGLDSEVVRDVVIDDDGRPWIASSAGVGVVDSAKRRYTDRSKGLPSLDVRALAVSAEGDVFALSKTAVARRATDSTTWKTLPMGGALTDEVPLGMVVDAKGRIWLGTGSALLMRPQ